MTNELLGDMLLATARWIGMLYIAMLSFGIYFQIRLAEPSVIVRSGELILGLVVIFIYWVEALGFISRRRTA